MFGGGGEDGIWRVRVMFTGDSPSCALAGSEQIIVASDESSVSSGNLLESMLLTIEDDSGIGTGRLADAVDGCPRSAENAGRKLSGFVGRRLVLSL